MPINWDVRVVRGKPKYQDVFLAYLDVLGFKNLMLRHAEKSPRNLVKLFDRIDGAVHHPRVSGLVQSYLSDSILLWCTDPASLPYMFEVCHTLQDELLIEGCLLRGAIVSGKHYRGYFDQLNIATGERDQKSGEIIVSPALVKAYLIEGKIKEPVIKVEGRVAIAHDDLFRGIPRRKRPLVRKLKPDGLYELPSHFMSLKFEILRAGASNGKRPAKDWQRHSDVREAIGALKTIRANIIDGISNSDPRIYRKWQFMKKRFNFLVHHLDKSWDLIGDLRIGSRRQFV